jgi:hypothetical protein
LSARIPSESTWKLDDTATHGFWVLWFGSNPVVLTVNVGWVVVIVAPSPGVNEVKPWERAEEAATLATVAAATMTPRSRSTL